jgi:DNA polymerase III subunit alpha
MYRTITGTHETSEEKSDRVQYNSIRFGMVAVKNVGENLVDSIVTEREQKGSFKTLRDFCERMTTHNINKRSIESLIKAGAFDSLGIKRAVLMSCFEDVYESVRNNAKSVMQDQLSMFEIDGNIEPDIVEDYPDLPEYKLEVMLAMEKEMTGCYLSAHPLDKVETYLRKFITMYSYDKNKNSEENEMAQFEFIDRTVIVGGIITERRNIMTKSNRLMAVLTVEDFYGTIEVVVYSNILERLDSECQEGNIVLVKGSVNSKEDEPLKIICEKIKNINEDNSKKKEHFGIVVDIKKFDQMFIKSLDAMLCFFEGSRRINIYNHDMEKISILGKEYYNVYLNPVLKEELEIRLGSENVLL